MNLFASFRNLFPQKPTIVVLVTAHNSDGTSTVQNSAGKFFRCKGQSVAVSSKAFVRGDEIIAPAQNLTVVVETI